MNVYDFKLRTNQTKNETLESSANVLLFRMNEKYHLFESDNAKDW